MCDKKKKMEDVWLLSKTIKFTKENKTTTTGSKSIFWIQIFMKKAF